MEECQRNIDNTVSTGKEDQEKIDYWKACIIQCQGLITYAHRMAEEAECQAASCTDEKRKKEELIRKGCKMIQEGQANPGFFNDYAAMKMTLGKGCTIEEARDWTIVGCIQPGPGGGSTDGSPDAGYVNMGKMIEFVLHNGVDPRTGKLMGLQTGDPREFKNIEEFKDALKKQILHHYKLVTTGYNIMQGIHMLRYPVIFASMVTKGCVESGKSVQQGGAKYSTAGLFITGAANMADSIAAIEKCVYEDKDITMDELIDALDHNFEGQERMRQLLLNKPEKFGNDEAHVDGIYREMMHFIVDEVQQWSDARGGHYSFNVHSQTVNVSHGAVCGATPDGRLSGEPFCDNAIILNHLFLNGRDVFLRIPAICICADSSQSELRLPLLQVVSSNKYFSVGVQSPTEINAPRGRTLSGRQWFCADRNGV